MKTKARPRHLERTQVTFLHAPAEVTGHCFSDGAVQIIAASDQCFTGLQFSRGNAEKLRHVLDKLLAPREIGLVP
jgi:hypothetical protein